MIEHRPNARNRNYFDYPLQGGGRGGYDYGRTPIASNSGAWSMRSYGFVFFCVVLGIGGTIFAGLL